MSSAVPRNAPQAAEPWVTVCIPTWESEAFIDTTLRFARQQTHRNLRILVSVDKSEDRTRQICKRHAREDRRVEVFSQNSRIGWARNINFLLDRVGSEYFVIYPHDDLIEPNYVASLLALLAPNPDAVSAQADVSFARQGGARGRTRGRSQQGSTIERVFASLVDPAIGEPMRGLIRTRALDAALRLPLSSMLGFDAAQPFQARLLAAGPALHLPRVLSWRWDARHGGLGDQWSKAPLHDFIGDMQVNVAQSLQLIDRLSSSRAEQATLRFALYLNTMLSLRRQERARSVDTLIEPGDISPMLDFTAPPPETRLLAPRIQGWLADAYMHLVRIESLHRLERGDLGEAFARLRTLPGWQAAGALPALGLRQLRHGLQRLLPSEMPADMRSRVAV